MQKIILASLMAIAILATIGLGFGLMQNKMFASANNPTAATRTTPSEQWMSLRAITLQPGEFLDLVNTTPFLTTKGHVAMYISCDSKGVPKIEFLQGTVDVGVNTLKPVDPEYLKQLSTPGKNCLYHFDIGTPTGVTDFAIINKSPNAIEFGSKNTITFSIVEGLQQLG